MRRTGRFPDVGMLVLLVLDVQFIEVLDTGVEQLVFGCHNSVDFAFWSLALLLFVSLNSVGYEH